MGLLTSFFRQPRETAAARQQRVMIDLLDIWQKNRPLADLWDVRKFVEDGYRRNTVIFACVTEISTSFSQPPLKAWTVNSQNKEVDLPPGHLLYLPLRKPNAKQSQRSLMRTFSVHGETAGNAYLFKVRARAGNVVNLNLLRPDAMRPIPDSNGEVTKFAYGFEPNIQILEAKDVIHEQLNPDPLDPYRGLSPIAVLARMGDLDNAAADFLRAFFLNAGIPAGLLKYKERIGDDAELFRIKTRWRENYSGVKGWHEVGVLDADVEYQEIGSKADQLKLEAIFGETESRMCSVYGVPPILIGAWIGLMRNTMANYGNARKSFYQETMQPKWANTADALTLGLAQEFGDYIQIGFDLEGIDALQEEKAGARKFALDSWNSGLGTKNECRKIVGWDQMPNGDVFKTKDNEGFAGADDDLTALQEAPDAEPVPATVQRMLPRRN